jgi:hypothetical protein
MNNLIGRNIAVFMLFVLLGLIAAGGCYTYAYNIKEVFTSLFSAVR